jgi:hypothetical protein
MAFVHAEYDDRNRSSAKDMIISRPDYLPSVLYYNLADTLVMST